MMTYKLPGVAGGSGVTEVDVIACDLTADNGVEGFGFSYAIGGRGAAALKALDIIGREIVANSPIEHPEATWRRAKAACNRIGRGPNFIGLAALDVALWDLHANCLEVPLGVAMGGALRPVAVYGSGGYRPNQGEEAVAAQICRHREQGLKAVKLRLSGQPGDIKMIEAARSAMGQDQWLMVDMNEKGNLTTARALTAAVLANGGLFIEEPLPAHDIEGYRSLAKAFPGAIASGEHLQGCEAVLPFLKGGLCGVIQPDLAMMGGLTEALRVARMAEAFGIEVMPHFLPGLFVHLAAAAPNVTWLEEFPLLEPLFDGVPTVASNGMLMAGAAAGHGLSLTPAARGQLLAA
ncbi:MAG: mandelate racemase/muconate lactonizing enzyme family protein [Erythrobacter sp.]|jgi:L-alanine-DL-glutamate epimerase-like enolase superfamily enzyme